MNNKFSSYFLMGLALGLGIGFGAGVFQAPDSGERTRRKFLKKAERLKQSMAKTSQHAKV
ncbi:MAG: YtxH domain-containing protein [Candidatus Sericytochromatia bacterium]